jgi:RHS repeat-associated protein
LGNGAGIDWKYDGARRLIEIRHQDASQQPLLTIQQLFDGVGNMRFRNDVLPAGNTGDSFRYDSSYWLTRAEARTNLPVFDSTLLAPATAPPPEPIPDNQTNINTIIGPLAQPPANSTWEYDLTGNRLQERRTSQPPTLYAVNNLDQYGAVNGQVLTYDLNGNLVGDGIRSYRYDSMNQLVRALDDTTSLNIAQFFHDAKGCRILEISGGVATHIFHDQLNIIAEYRAGIPFAQYVHDDGVDRAVQIAANGSENWYHSDLVGSVRLLSDANGDLAAEYSYTPFGITSGGFVPYNPVRFNGRRSDAALASYDFRTRQYDPVIGRFTQRDAAAMADGTNLYVYTGNNPLVFIDPSGRNRELQTAYDTPKLVPPRECTFWRGCLPSPYDPKLSQLEISKQRFANEEAREANIQVDPELSIVEDPSKTPLHERASQEIAKALSVLSAALILADAPLLIRGFAGQARIAATDAGIGIGADEIVVRKTVPLEDLLTIRQSSSVGRPAGQTYVTLPRDMQEIVSYENVIQRLTLAPEFSAAKTGIEFELRIPNKGFVVGEGTQGGLGWTEGGAIDLTVPSQPASTIQRFRIHSSGRTSPWVEGNPFE